MRTIISIILLALCHTMSFAQGWVDDIWFNKPKSAVFINDVFVKGNYSAVGADESSNLK